MAEQNKNGKTQIRLEDDQRFKYIGFEVFPGKVKDLFKNDAEKKRLEEHVAKKRAEGDSLREDCQLMVERVSMGEKILLTVACVMIVAALFIPFYSVYTRTEITNETVATTTSAETALVDDAMVADSGLLVDDSTALLATTEGDTPAGDEAVTDDTDLAAATEATTETTTETEGEPTLDDQAAATTQAASPNVSIDAQGREVITGHVARKKYSKDYERVSGFGSLIAIGSLGSYLFSSGFVLMLTAILLLVYTLGCLALPGLTLYTLYGTKAKNDDLALKLKKALKMSWLPISLCVAAFLLSFVGADYSFSTTDTFTSIGQAYTTGVLLDTLSYGVILSLGGFIILAAKGSEI